MKKIFLVLVLAVLLYADRLSLFPHMMESNSIVSMSLNGGGSAVVQGPGAQALNPALLSTWNVFYPKKVFVSGYYGQDDKDLRDFGVSGMFALTPENIIGAEFYRAEDEIDSNSYIRGAISISGPVMKDGEQDLNLGITLNYLDHEREFSAYHNGLKSLLPTITTVSGTSDTSWLAAAVDGENRERIITTDIAFYQIDKENGMTFSLVFENLLGYKFHERLPSEVTLSDTSTGGDTIVTTVAYGDVKEVRKFLGGEYKSLLIGAVSKLPMDNNNVTVSIPLDLRFWSFLDKDLRDREKEFRDRVEAYAGLELYSGKIGGRIAYSWRTPRYYTNMDGMPMFHPEHTFSWGLSASVKNFLVDAAFAQEGFKIGLTAGF